MNKGKGNIFYSSRLGFGFLLRAYVSLRIVYFTEFIAENKTSKLNSHFFPDFFLL